MNKVEIKLDFLNGLQLLDGKFPAARDLIEGLIREQSVNMLAGEPGCGKSILAMNLALAVATGEETFLGRKIMKHGKVLYLNNEMALPDFRERLEKMAGLAPHADLLLQLTVPIVMPLLVEAYASIREWCRENRPVLIIFDCLYLLHTADENDASSMRNIATLFNSLRDEFGVAILILHHNKKEERGASPNINSARGSNVQSAFVDTLLDLRRVDATGNRRKLTPTKLRHVSDAQRKGMNIELDPKNLWFVLLQQQDDGGDGDGGYFVDAIDFVEIFQGRVEMQMKEILAACKPLGCSSKTVQRAVERAVKNGTLVNVKFGVFAIRNDATNNTEPW